MNQSAVPQLFKGYRARFRFRTAKKLNCSQEEINFQIDGVDVRLSAVVQGTPIKDSEWLVANARGFESEEAARQFAQELKEATALASVANRLGVDAGIDMPTSGLASAVKEHIRQAEGLVFRDNVHGVDVFPDDPNVRFISLQATGTVRSGPEPFLTDVSDFMARAVSLSPQARDTVLLLNWALLRQEPVAQIVFSISAVEMLGQTEQWSAAQRQLIAELAKAGEDHACCSANERDEVVFAIRNGLKKLSLRQGVLRLLARLGLLDLKKEWDAVYGERSTLVHGLAPKPGTDYSPLAFRAVSLCGRILLTAVAREYAGVDRHVDRVYPATSS